jgi:lysophospholipase L1-like esterase
MPRPELMAIGDSCYNGTRSLTTNAEMARLSVPAQVAKAFGWDFKTPSYPFDILFDLEAVFRSGSFDLDALKAGILANADAWLGLDPWSNDECFDNISIAQTTINDQSKSTYLNHVSQILGLVNGLRQAQGIDFETVAKLYQAINTSFILNPSRDPASPFADKTPLEIVAMRKPRRLLVNVGINDGIWTVCLLGTNDQFSPDDMAIAMFDLGRRLHELKAAGDVDQIYLNLMPRPSCVANLMPRRDPDKLPASGYFPEYLGRLGQIGGLTGDEMRAIDEEVRELNKQIRDELGNRFAPTGGLTFVDTYAKMEARDNKHFRERKEMEIWIGNRRCNNVPLARLGPFIRGGLYGLDNLHPSSVGYAVLAEAVCAQIQATEGIQPATPIDFAAAFNADSLLTNLPSSLDFSTLLINFVVDLGRLFAGPKVSPTS